MTLVVGIEILKVLFHCFPLPATPFKVEVNSLSAPTYKFSGWFKHVIEKLWITRIVLLQFAASPAESSQIQIAWGAIVKLNTKLFVALFAVLLSVAKTSIDDVLEKARTAEQ